MASNPPGGCCTIGVKHEGEARGKIKNIDDSKFMVHAMSGETSISLTGIKSAHTFPTLKTRRRTMRSSFSRISSDMSPSIPSCKLMICTIYIS